ncbi:hypothetical protein NLX83_25505 [Allokutzneria sp. A3M-2-11 16]|uniref:hypothetical protein n=1 Tax=Allokutzneria sp. A3M-2-11 16 TaxID=2962043 RepID=UPI0020B84CA6|nr:hypothetical protein [Allokutzneria sp. A3M-2-11 16]MCP3802634.1 hypothetical protein [Allokutzneria sp. A3M-2-11 16]
MFGPKWDGRPGRLEVWYTTFTDPVTGTGFWVHVEVLASRDGVAHEHGWIAVFPPDAEPVFERFGPVPAVVGREPDLLVGSQWSLTAEDDGSAPLYTFPRWAWKTGLLPAAQVVPRVLTWFTGTVTVGGRTWELRAAPGAIARIYGHGNAHRWAWLHADLGGGDVLEIVAAVARRPRLRPLPLVQLRLSGVDWPRRPLLSAFRFTARIELPVWTVRGLGLDVTVTQDPSRCVRVDYTDPDGATAVCVNSEAATAEVVFRGRRWLVDGRAHAEVGLR